jgi:hypothetical protein
MSVFHNNALIGASGQAGAGPSVYSIERSLRFNSSDSAYLSKSLTSSRTTATFSAWVKRGNLSGSTNYQLFGWSDGTSNSVGIRFNNDRLEIFNYASGSFNAQKLTTAVYRDASAWYHIVGTFDTTSGTAADRLRLYANGERITTFTTSVDASSSLTLNLGNGNTHGIGAFGGGSLFDYFSGYLADIHFIDGQALDPTSFGEFDDNGIWQPKAFAGSYGTNGFHLDFADNSSNTATTLGKDTSPNGNNWTPNNLSVTAGAGNDSLVDVPTNGAQTDTGIGGEVRGNYCTLNPLRANSSHTLSNGNLDISLGGAGATTTFATFGVSTGKWYWEMTCGTQASFYPSAGVNTNLSASVADQSGVAATGYQYMANGQKFNNSALSSYGASYTTNDVIGVALDMDAGTLTFYKNGASQGQAFSGITGTAVPTVIGLSASAVFNFGQRAFAYTAPSGFKALNTANLPAPVVTKPSDLFDVKLYTGNGSTQTISGLGFSPDLVWIKARNTSTWWNQVFDAVRGAGYFISTNDTGAEAGGGTSLLSAFTSDGFSVNMTPNGTVNENNDTFVAWAWDAGTSTVTNTDGSISSQVRANASAGFSVVTYTGTGSAATVGHGLGVAPAMVIIKSRTTSDFWVVGHTSVGFTTDNYLRLNGTDSAGAGGGVAWNNTAPTSTVVHIGSSSVLNGNGNNLVMYAWAPLAGYSSGFSYTGNGSADGVFQYLGFRPRLIMLKRSDSTSNWTLLDTSREGYNVDNDPLYPNLSDAEGTTDLLDITSNGFKLRSTDASVNASAATYIGFAWAEHPFQYARAR